MSVNEANTFRALDDLFESATDRTLREKILEKKQAMLNFVDNGKLTASKYINVCKRIMS